MASLSGIHEAVERGEPVALLVMGNLSDVDRCELLIEEWVEEDVLPVVGSNPCDELLAHFRGTPSLSLSSIEYRLWPDHQLDALLLRYRHQDELEARSREPAWWE